MRGQSFFEQQLAAGQKAERFVKSTLENYYNCKVESIADKNIGYDFIIKQPDGYEFKADVKHTVQWPNVGIDFNEFIVLNSTTADMWIFFCDTQNYGKPTHKYLFIETAALKDLAANFKHILTAGKFNNPGSPLETWWHIDYKVLREFCYEKGYYCQYRQFDTIVE